MLFRSLSEEVRIGDDDNPDVGKIIVELDRPIPLSISSTAILPIYQPLGSCIRGLLLGFIGSDDGMAMYRRLGSISCSSDLLENEPLFSVSGSDTVVITAVFRPYCTTSSIYRTTEILQPCKAVLQPCKCSTTVQKLR